MGTQRTAGGRLGKITFTRNRSPTPFIHRYRNTPLLSTETPPRLCPVSRLHFLLSNSADAVKSSRHRPLLPATSTHRRPQHTEATTFRQHEPIKHSLSSPSDSVVAFYSTRFPRRRNERPCNTSVSLRTPTSMYSPARSLVSTPTFPIGPERIKSCLPNAGNSEHSMDLLRTMANNLARRMSENRFEWNLQWNARTVMLDNPSRKRHLPAPLLSFSRTARRTPKNQFQKRNWEEALLTVIGQPRRLSPQQPSLSSPLSTIWPIYIARRTHKNRFREICSTQWDHHTRSKSKKVLTSSESRPYSFYHSS